MQVLAVIAYIGIGVVQFVAILHGLDVWFDFPNVVDFLIAMALAWFPLVGSICGMVGAVDVWGWTWYGAALLFFWPVVLFAFLAAYASITENRR